MVVVVFGCEFCKWAKKEKATLWLLLFLVVIFVSEAKKGKATREFVCIFVSGAKKEKATWENGRIVRGRPDFLSILLHWTIFSFPSSYLVLL